MIEKLNEKHLCWYGDSEFYLKDNRVFCRARDSDASRLIYSNTPIKRGYRQFMCVELANALENNGLFC